MVRLMILSLLSVTVSAWAQGANVSARFVVHSDDRSGRAASKKAADAPEVVMWLSPLQAFETRPANPAHHLYRMVQKDKQFTPHLLVVPTGTSVEFPNDDPFFHNVFSLYDGKRFDLGLYEPGTSRSVRFDREGVSYIFCNIHPKMAAVVLALSTPFYAVSEENGTVVIHDVPPGSYELHVWSERAKPVSPGKFQRVVRVSAEGLNLGEMDMESTTSPMMNHKNKFGEDYNPEPALSY